MIWLQLFLLTLPLGELLPVLVLPLLLVAAPGSSDRSLQDKQEQHASRCTGGQGNAEMLCVKADTQHHDITEGHCSKE
jgi:hypothetical protein